MTADFPTLVASRSMLAPSSADSAVGSRSSSSTTFPTRYGSCLKRLLAKESNCNLETGRINAPVIFDLVEVVLDLLCHCRLLMA
jgi:hypothetical protein